MKKVAVIQDLSSFGKCSLTAAVPVLSVMGVQACPLPTAILSAQTEYPSFFCEDLTANMPLFIEEWDKLQERFDGIHTGFITGKKQIAHIFRFLELFKKDGTLLLVDPVMGDRGDAYTNFDDDLLSRMKELIMHADLITPNVTECCLLTGLSYDALKRQSDAGYYLKKIEEAGQELRQQTGARIIITGVNPPGCQQTRQIGNLCIEENRSAWTSVPFNGKSYSGTGDLFASVLMGSLMRGSEMTRAIQLAEKFLTASIEDTSIENTPEVAGVNFEKYLHMLL